MKKGIIQTKTQVTNVQTKVLWYTLHCVIQNVFKCVLMDQDVIKLKIFNASPRKLLEANGIFFTYYNCMPLKKTILEQFGATALMYVLGSYQFYPPLLLHHSANLYTV